MAEFTEHVVTDLDGDEIVVQGAAYDSGPMSGHPWVYIYTSEDGVALTVDQITELVANLGEALEAAEHACTVAEESEPTIEVGDIVQVHGYESEAWNGAIGRVIDVWSCISVDILSGLTSATSYGAASFPERYLRVIGKAL